MKKFFIMVLSFSLLLAGCSSAEEKEKSTEEKSTNEKTSTKQNVTQKKQTSVDNEESNVYGNMGNTGGNISNGGIAAEYSDMVYYSDSKSLLVTSKSEVSDMELDGEILDSVNDGEGGIDSINVMNGNLYYVKGSKIFKMNIDAKETKELSTPYPISRMFVYKDGIIFTTYDSESQWTSLYKMGTNGEDIKEIANDIQNFYVDQGKLYWSKKVKERDYRLYIDDLEDNKEPAVKSHYSLDSFQMDGDTLYFLDEGDYFKMDLNGMGSDLRNMTASIKQTGATIDFPNLSGDVIYHTEDGKMFAMDKLGSERWEVPTSNVYAYSVAGGHLFYWRFIEGDYHLAVVENVSGAYDTAVKEANEQMANTDTHFETPEELLKLYDDVAKKGNPISIGELEERESTITGGEILFPQEHLIGAVKLMLYGISTENENFLASILANPVDEFSRFDEALSNLPIKEDYNGGYYDFSIQVISDTSVYIQRDRQGYDMNVVAEFKIIDGKYYFDGFRG